MENGLKEVRSEDFGLPRNERNDEALNWAWRYGEIKETSSPGLSDCLDTRVRPSKPSDRRQLDGCTG